MKVQDVLRYLNFNMFDVTHLENKFSQPKKNHIVEKFPDFFAAKIIFKFYGDSCEKNSLSRLIGSEIEAFKEEISGKVTKSAKKTTKNKKNNLAELEQKGFLTSVASLLLLEA